MQTTEVHSSGISKHPVEWNLAVISILVRFYHIRNETNQVMQDAYG